MRDFRVLTLLTAVASMCCYGQCPLKFGKVDPNNDHSFKNFNRGVQHQATIPEFKARVQNVSGKDIRGLKVRAAYYDATEDLHSIPVAWNWQSGIKAGVETTLHWDNAEYQDTGFVGWLVVPEKILFEDGSTWEAGEAADSINGCFGEYWRNKKHPRLTTLPVELQKIAETGSSDARGRK